MNETPTPKKDIFTGHRWEGEQCKCCKHSSTLHPRGGFCTRVNCECDKFVYSGVQVETTS